MQAKLAELLLRFFSLFSLSIAHKTGSVIGRIAYALPNSLKRPLKINIDLCFPDLSKQERESLARSSFVEMTKALTESGAMFTWDSQKLLHTIQQISGEEHLKQAFEKGKGVILAVPHLGCWELISVYCTKHYPFTALYRPLRLKGLDPFIKHARQRFGSTLVPTEASGIRALFKALNKNEIIAILPDQDPGREGSVFAGFFGVPASTMTLVPRLVEKTAAAVVYTYAERLPDGKGYHIHFVPESRNLGNMSLQEATEAMNQGVERCVRQIPAQYQWAYKRFKTRPEGEQRIY